ncbi:MAG: hypothetical protein ACK58T_10650, partial [Phycisphaerae bacterium]
MIALICCCPTEDSAQASESGSQFRVGTGMRIITPNPLLPISGGVGEPNPATGKLGEITVRAMVF